MPFFSVLMPTRNRASLLRSSLKSAVDQTFQDFEIVVSDNNSTDDTRQVVRDFMTGGKVKYVNPGRDLSMCANWEYVLTHASGQYLIYLCDDDALAPDTLSYVHDLLRQFQMEVLVWRASGYHHPDIPDENLRLHFTYQRSSGELFEVASRPIIEALCRFDWSVNGIVPKMLNCAVSRKAIEICCEHTGEFFVPPYPDFSAVGQLLSTNPTYHFIDLPLYVAGASRVSNAGILFDRKKKHDEYVSLFGSDLLEGVPYQMPYLVTSYFYATWLLFRRIYSRAFTADINTAAYLKVMFTELVRFEDYEDISAELDELAAHMRDFSGSDQMFRDLWDEHQRSKGNGAKPGADQSNLSPIKRVAWAIAGKNERAFNLLARARGHKVSEFTHKRVPSIEAAAKILSGYLARQARPTTELKPVPVSSSNFLKERQ